MKLIPTYTRHNESPDWIFIYKGIIYIDDEPIDICKAKDITHTYKMLVKHHYVRNIPKHELYAVKQRFIKNCYNKDSV